MADAPPAGAVILDFIVDPAAVMRAGAIAGQRVLQGGGGGIGRGLMISLAVGGGVGLLIGLVDLSLEAVIGLGAGFAIGAVSIILMTRRNSLRLLQLGYRALEDPPRCRITLDATGVRSRLGGHGWSFDWHAVEAALQGPDGLILLSGFYAILLPDSALPEGMDRAGLQTVITGWAGDFEARSRDAGVF